MVVQWSCSDGNVRVQRFSVQDPQSLVPVADAHNSFLLFVRRKRVLNATISSDNLKHQNDPRVNGSGKAVSQFVLYQITIVFQNSPPIPPRIAAFVLLKHGHRRRLLLSVDASQRKRRTEPSLIGSKSLELASMIGKSGRACRSIGP